MQLADAAGAASARGEGAASARGENAAGAAIGHTEDLGPAAESARGESTASHWLLATAEPR